MPSYGKWRDLKIVEPTPSRAQEISGGIKNALDRGESLKKAKQTFINSGYTAQEVQKAAQLARSQSAKPLNPNQAATTILPKPKSKKTIIILSVVGAVILILALVLFLLRDKIF